MFQLYISFVFLEIKYLILFVLFLFFITILAYIILVIN